MPSPTILQWAGITVAGDNSSLYHLDDLAGWLGDMPPSRVDSEPRPNAHGESDTPVWSSARVVTLTGSCRTNNQRDALFQTLAAVSVYAGDAAPATLTVQDAGLTLTTPARIIAATPARVAGAWGLGQFGFQVQWRCADPLLYGSVQTGNANMSASTGGLVWPAFTPSGVMSFGTTSAASSCSLTNPGSMDAPVTFVVAAGGTTLTGGFRIIETLTGRILQYIDDLTAGTSVTINGANGTVLLGGATDRNGSLTIRQWTPVPAGQTRTYTIAGITSTSPTTVMTALMQPAYM